MRKTTLASSLFLAALFSFAPPLFAQNFSGRVVTMIVNYSPGGPTDIEARVVAKYLPKYLQGVRAVIVRNVPGAGGNIGVNQLGEQNADEKLNIGFFTWDPVDQLIQNKSLHVRYNDLKFIAAFRQVSLVYMRRDTLPGMSRPADIVKAKDIKAGALSPSNHATVRQRLALDLLGVRYETIPGYKGLRDIELAVQQGDLQLTNNSLPGWYSTIKPNLVDKGIVMPVFQYDVDRPDGSTGRSIDLPDVQAFTEVFKEVKGPTAMPSGERWEALQLLGRIMDSMYRTVFMPPHAPREAVEEMRAAFEKLAKDPEFIAAYEKIVRTKPNMIIGTPGETILADLGKVSPTILTFLRQYIDSSRQ
jgi:tripartite-type tricarboxylate transporter receptor subunit TctC